MTWLQTYTGRKFDLQDPTPDMVLIEDIAHALSLVCRFGGHCREFYSVASHCIIVSKIVPIEFCFEGLLHDAGEAYVQDLIRPVKQTVGQPYKVLESKVLKAIGEKFDVCLTKLPKEVHHADMVALATEQRDLLTVCEADWTSMLPEPLKARIEPIPSAVAEKAFLRRFYNLQSCRRTA